MRRGVRTVDVIRLGIGSGGDGAVLRAIGFLFALRVYVR